MPRERFEEASARGEAFGGEERGGSPEGRETRALPNSGHLHASPFGRGLAKEDLLRYVEETAAALEYSGLEFVANAAWGALESQRKFTPAYYRQKADERRERKRILVESLQRPGLILIAWAYAIFPEWTRAKLQAYWLPESGPRWPLTGWGSIEEARAIEPSCPHRGQEDFRKRIVERIEAAKTLPRAWGEVEYGAPGLHLLAPGPERRKAYLSRQGLAAEEANGG